MADISRNKEQELIVTSLYDALLYVDLNKEFDLKEIMEGVYKLPYKDIPVFSKEVVIKSLSHINDMIPIYQEKMPTWRFDRINNISKAILFMAYTEMKYMEGGVKSIVIDVSVRLAKKYLDEKDYKFINAILDNVL